MVRVLLPTHLRQLAGVDDEVLLDVPAPVTQAAILDALEARFPMLRGTIRDQATGKRRPFLRFLHAGAISRTRRPTSRCPIRFPVARSRSWWLEPSRADDGNSFRQTT